MVYGKWVSESFAGFRKSLGVPRYQRIKLYIQYRFLYPSTRVTTRLSALSGFL